MRSADSGDGCALRQRERIPASRGTRICADSAARIALLTGRGFAGFWPRIPASHETRICADSAGGFPLFRGRDFRASEPRISALRGARLRLGLGDAELRVGGRGLRWTVCAWPGTSARTFGGRTFLGHHSVSTCYAQNPDLSTRFSGILHRESPRPRSGHTLSEGSQHLERRRSPTARSDRTRTYLEPRRARAARRLPRWSRVPGSVTCLVPHGLPGRRRRCRVQSPP